MEQCGGVSARARLVETALPRSENRYLNLDLNARMDRGRAAPTEQPSLLNHIITVGDDLASLRRYRRIHE